MTEPTQTEQVRQLAAWMGWRWVPQSQVPGDFYYEDLWQYKARWVLPNGKLRPETWNPFTSLADAADVEAWIKTLPGYDQMCYVFELEYVIKDRAGHASQLQKITAPAHDRATAAYRVYSQEQTDAH